MKIELTTEEFNNLTVNKPVDINKLYPEQMLLYKPTERVTVKQLDDFLKGSIRKLYFNVYNNTTDNSYIAPLDKVFSKESHAYVYSFNTEACELFIEEEKE